MEIVNKDLKPTFELTTAWARLRYERDGNSSWDRASESTKKTFIKSSERLTQDLINLGYILVKP